MSERSTTRPSGIRAQLAENILPKFWYAAFADQQFDTHAQELHAAAEVALAQDRQLRERAIIDPVVGALDHQRR